MREVVIVVPCYNEARRLEPDAFVRATKAMPGLRIRFVDDGSTDETRFVLARTVERIGRGRAHLQALPANVGKAEAVRAGVSSVLEDDTPFAVGYWDADLSTPLADVERFTEVLEDRPETLAVIGSRIRLMGRAVQRRAARHYGGRVFATLASLVLGFPVYDTQCGAKLFRATDEVRTLFDTSFVTDWAFDVELLARLASARGRDLGSRGVVVEHPLMEWVDVSGSKVRVSDLPRMLYDLAVIHRRYRAG